MITETSNVFKTANVSGWEDFLECLPNNWQEIAKNNNVLKGQRKDKDPETLMHVMMLHLLCGYSLRETSAIAEAAHIATLSDVALLKRLRKSSGMFKDLCSELFSNFQNTETFSNYHIRLVDGTIIREPGQFGTQWRLHYSFSLPSMTCDSFKLTKASGKGTGEGLEQFSINPNDILMADRGFCRFNCFDHVAKENGYCCIRWNSKALRLCNNDESLFDFQNFFESLTHEGMCRETDAYMKGKKSKNKLRCRICAIKKNDESAKRARKLLMSDTDRKSKTPSQLALLACDYIVLITTLPRESFNLKTVLNMYRLRWQVELVFKRFKSIIKIGALPKYTDSSAEAWLYGKMFIALLIEKFYSRLGAFSPWRALERSSNTKKLVERIQDFVSHYGTVGHSNH